MDRLPPDLEAKLLRLTTASPSRKVTRGTTASGTTKPATTLTPSSKQPSGSGERVVIVVTVPGCKVVSEANRRDHWAVKRRRARDQATMAHAALIGVGNDARDRIRAAPFVRIRFTRVGGKRLDSDNLVGAFKAIRDTVAKWLRVDDGSDRLRFDWPVQECGETGVRIELTEERE